MSTAMPQIPPRPTRSQAQDQATLGSEIPKIPPRPTRRIDRSQSPSRESFARSPLNEPPSHARHGSQASVNSSGGHATIATEPPARPASVSLPSIGQEGSEYGEVFGTPEMGTSPTQTRNIANDLKLYAPKPSLPVSSAKQRVSTVTRTDSEQAASFGIGKSTGDDRDPGSRQLKNRASFASQTSNGPDRPPSSQGSDHGIPEIGQRVPMYPHAGDVQAPSPAPFAQPFEKGIGFHNDGSKPRHHGRRISGQEFKGPPGSYGLHGHGVVPNDRFEKAYYEKHPELFKKETGAYHGGDATRAEWAMSSEDLNKIVRDTASRGAGLGTSPAVISTPSEEIGFQATEEYASRMSSPKPSSGYNVALSNASQTHVDSPLRKASFPADGQGKEYFEGSLAKGLRASSDAGFESEVEDEDTIHVDEPGRRGSKVYGSNSRFQSTEDLRPYSSMGGEDEENHDEHGYSAPILASDEVAKEPFGYELQPAVSPLHERRSGSYDDSGYHQRTGSASSLAGSRPSSRPGSIHGLPFDRDNHSTPLENLEEYEPLFPEDEKSHRPLTAADRLKRPELKNRKFPSQDVWEDTPASLQHTATVSTPQLPEDKEDTPGTQSLQVREGETPEQAFARRQEELAEEESKSQSFLHQEKKPWAHKSHLAAETRPGLKQRFPSRDIWEDTPDSLQLQTTVAGPQSEERDILSPPDERPTTGAVAFHQEKAAAGLPLGSEEGRATTGIAATLKPQIPARPAKAKPGDAAQPLIPDRPARKQQLFQPDAPQVPLASKPKPQVPARPSKVSRDSSENVPLTQVASNSSAKSVGSDTGSAAAAKPKPPVPARPMGSKIAALQGGFLSDLNKRLQLGPQAPKKEEAPPEQKEEEKEKAPLVDARKGRARGPARRAPAKSPAPAAAVAVEKPTVFGCSTPATQWYIHPDEGSLHVPSYEVDTVTVHESKENSSAPDLTSNTADEELNDVVEPATAVVEILDTSPKDHEASEQPIATETSITPKDELEKEPESTTLQEGRDDEELSTSISTLKPNQEKQVE